METIESLKEKIKELEDRKNELERGDNTDTYDEALDEAGDIHIGNLRYSPSQVLKAVDKIAYNEGLRDFNDVELTDIIAEIEEAEARLKELGGKMQILYHR